MWHYSMPSYLWSTPLKYKVAAGFLFWTRVKVFETLPQEEMTSCLTVGDFTPMFSRPFFSMTVGAEYVGKPWSTSHCKVSWTAYSGYTCLCGTVLYAVWFFWTLNDLIICLNGLFPGRQLLKTKTWDCDFIRVYTVSWFPAVIANRTVTELLFPLRRRLKVGRNEFPAGF